MVNIEKSSKEAWFRLNLIMRIYSEEQESISNEMEKIHQKKEMSIEDIKKLQDLMEELTKKTEEFRADLNKIQKEEQKRLR